MTLEQAHQIEKLLITKRELETQIRDISACQHISGQITIGPNGLGFYWARHDPIVEHILEGLQSDLQATNDAIINIQVEGL